MVGISQPEKIATISVRNDAAFLFSVVGTTSIAAVVSVATQSRCWAGRLGWADGWGPEMRAGSLYWGCSPQLRTGRCPPAVLVLLPSSTALQVLGQLPGDWGFFSSYLTGEPGSR